MDLAAPDMELQLIGTLLSYPDASRVISDEVDPDWFSDACFAAWFRSIKDLQDKGVVLSPKVAVAKIPAELRVEDMTPGQIYARAVADALPITAVHGLIEVIKELWARRQLTDNAAYVRNHASDPEFDPFELTANSVSFLDSINAARNARESGFLSDGALGVLNNLSNPSEGKAPSTGLRSLDRIINGYPAGKMYVIAGRPGMGKSAFMCSSLRRTAADGHGVAIFSLEMSQEEIAARCLSDSLDTVTAPTFSAILKRETSQSGIEALAVAAESFEGLPLHVDASPRLTFSEIAARARKIKAVYEAQGTPLAVVCVDHMGLIEPSDRYRGNKVAEAGEISRLAKVLAKELNCCVILLCQLSRQVEGRDDKRPIMSDLRWSGDIEQDADMVAFLYREHYYLKAQADADPNDVAAAKHRLEILIRKNRNGETGDVPLQCSIGHSSIRDLNT